MCAVQVLPRASLPSPNLLQILPGPWPGCEAGAVSYSVEHFGEAEFTSFTPCIIQTSRYGGWRANQASAPFSFPDLVPVEGMTAEHNSLTWGFTTPCSMLAVNLGV